MGDPLVSLDSRESAREIASEFLSDPSVSGRGSKRSCSVTPDFMESRYEASGRACDTISSALTQAEAAVKQYQVARRRFDGEIVTIRRKRRPADGRATCSIGAVRFSDKRSCDEMSAAHDRLEAAERTAMSSLGSIRRRMVAAVKRTFKRIVSAGERLERSVRPSRGRAGSVEAEFDAMK